MVKQTLCKESVDVPSDVTLEIKSRIVTAKGPKGDIVKSFRKFPVQILTEKNESGKITKIVVRRWFSNQKEKSCVNSTRKHLQNMIDGVTREFKTIMKYGYKFFGMKLQTLEDGKVLEIQKFAGRLEKFYVRAVPGVRMVLSSDE